MSARPWYAFYPADYHRKAAHLTMLQHGAYRLLLDHYYSTGKPLPANADALQRICMALADAERAAIDVVVAMFFVRDGDVLRHKRADEEIERAEEISKKRKNAAKIRYAKAPANGHALAEQKHTQSQSQSQSQSHIKEINRSPPRSEPDGFAQWYAIYPRHVGRGQAKRAFQTALKKIDLLALATATERFSSECRSKDQNFIPHPATWLNGERWADEAAVTQAQPPPEFEDTDLAGWLQRIRIFHSDSKLRPWNSRWGPPPGALGCKIPPAVLRPENSNKISV